MKPGDMVIYTDSIRRDHNALVTAVWGPVCINVVYTSQDESKTDSYGRQIERQTSAMKYDANNWNFGSCWREVGTEATFVDHPLSK